MNNKRNRPRRESKVCLNCGHCIPIGEGDHICDIAEPDQQLVVEDYAPTEDHMWCEGEEWTER